MIFITKFSRYNFKCKLRRRAIFIIFLLSGQLTAHKVIKVFRLVLRQSLRLKTTLHNYLIKY